MFNILVKKLLFLYFFAIIKSIFYWKYQEFYGKNTRYKKIRIKDIPIHFGYVHKLLWYCDDNKR